MGTIQIKTSIKDLVYITLQHMKKRKSRILLSIGNIFLGIALVSSMMIISSSYATRNSSTLLMVNLNEYQLWVSIISIFVCIITIFNSMLISVVERYKEIGVMKCLGARNSLIMKLFLLEAILIGLIGGILGFLTATFFTLPVILQLGSIPSLISYIQILFVAFFVAIIISTIAAIYPALYASKINPVDALRYEV
ncbi:MAG: FtsX-like permease family protein [Candidatus Methanomethylicia archaeon]